MGEFQNKPTIKIQTRIEGFTRQGHNRKGRQRLSEQAQGTDGLTKEEAETGAC